MSRSEPQTSANRPPSLEEVVRAKQVLLRHHCTTVADLPRYPVPMGLVPIRVARRLLLGVSVAVALTIGCAAILGIWEIISTDLALRVALTAAVVFIAFGSLVAANRHFGPVKWMTADEQREREIV